MISVIIATRNRPNKLRECIKSILINNFKDFEVVVIDQSLNSKSKEIINSYRSNKIKYYKMHRIGKSKALNFGLSKVMGDIVSFTDDDCIVTKSWLKQIDSSFKMHDSIVGVFGSVYPYLSKRKKDRVCPCIVTRKKEMIISKPVFHSKYIGYGNNMSFKRSIFSKVGLFQEWLGPGSIGSNAEDAEFVLRCLLKKNKIFYNPKVKVYHQRWLDNNEYINQSRSYLNGEISSYGYLAFQGVDLGKRVIRKNLLNYYKRAKKNIKALLLFKKTNFYVLIQEGFSILKSLLIARYFSIIKPLKI